MTQDLEGSWLSTLDGQPRHNPAQVPREDAPAHGDPGSGQPSGFLPPEPSGWTDGLTDVDGPRLWYRVMASEQARNARHRRTSTVAIFAVEGVDRAADRWGTALSLQLFVELARSLVAGIRKSDYVARIAPTRLGVLLTETDEVSAINFIDRVIARCSAAVDPAANDIRVIAGLASPEVGGRLVDAMRVAEGRLEDARRQTG